MPNGLIILIVVAVVALILVGAYYSYQAQQKRLAELSQLASARGWQFESAHDSSHDQRFSCFSIFRQGDDRYAYNTFRGDASIGDRAWPLQAGDFHYQTTTTSTDGKGHATTTTHNHQLSYLILDTPFLGAPHLYIRREGFFDKVAGFLGFDDIDFESAEFSKRFCVKSPDKRFAYDVIHPRMMEYLLDHDPPVIDFQRGQCCLSRGEKCWSAAEFEAAVAWAEGFFALWPRHVTSLLDAQESRAPEEPQRG